MSTAIVAEPVTLTRRAWVEQVMGMPVSIHLRGTDLTTPRIERAVAAAFADLRRTDELFSTWNPASQVSRIRRGELGLAAADPLVRDVVRLCDRARSVTDGWFDANLPDGAGGRGFDPTGLVKGWAVQRACTTLAASLTEHDVLVNAGGDIAVSCGRAQSPAWRLGIEDPGDRSRLLAAVELRTGGLATSGTAARGSHIVSPRTGEPAVGLASVSVAGPSLLWADVYATAALARGVGCVDWLGSLTEHAWLVVRSDGAQVSSR